MRKAIWYGLVISGLAAAYLMFKRGAPLGEIAEKAVEHPIGTLMDELKAAN